MSINYPTVSWVNGSNIFEVNIRQYTPAGTFQAFTGDLPRLRNMGVEILWLMPITPISEKKRLGSLGSYYACSSYTKINPEYGNLEDFKMLIKEAHRLGFKVIIDWVANHTGWDHEWVGEHPDWYLRDVNGNFTELNGWADVIDLDYTNTEMRTALISAMQYWINDCDIDGFRCDMAHLVPLDFWNTARQKCDDLKALLWLGECEVTAYTRVFDLTYAWDWMHLSENFIKNKASLQEIRDVLLQYEKNGQHSAKLFFTSNHDENSWNGTEYEKYGDAAKAFAVFTCTWQGIPLVYSGQDLPNLKRLKFFEKDSIAWKDQSPLLFPFYRQLLQLRRNNTALHREADQYFLTTGLDDKIMAYLSINGKNRVLTLLNLTGNNKLRFTITDQNLAGKFRNIFSGLVYDFTPAERFELQAWEYFVYEAIG